jgi:hypothetical protein
VRFLLPIAMTATVLVVCVKSARRQPRLETVVVFGLVIICYSWAWVVTA